MASTPGPVSKSRGVLIVDDSGYARTRLSRFLAEQGFDHVVEAADGTEALLAFSRHHPTLVLLDQVMRGGDGLGTARQMLAADPGVHIIMMTAVTDRGLLLQALETGIRRVMQKMDLGALAAAFRELGYD